MSDDTAQLVRAQTSLAVRLLGLLGRAPGNLVYSPFSIATVLQGLAIAAQGKTATELLEVLGSSMPEPRIIEAGAALLQNLLPSSQAHVELRIVNDLWIQRGQGILPSFLEHFARLARGTVERVDFDLEADAVRERINARVAEATRGRIGQLVLPGDLDRDWRTALVSVAYFKAQWATKFEVHQTGPIAFRTPAGETKVPGMHLRHEFGHAENEHLQALELPYVGLRFALGILLPREIDGLTRCEQMLSADPGQLFGLLERLRPTDVQAVLPRFTCNSRMELRPTLEALGVRDAFTPGRADFPGLGKGFAVGSASHGGSIEVNEEGTEAAAATVAWMTLGSRIGRPGIRFVADHPFLFVLRDRKTGTVLFVGRVAQA